MSELRFEQLVVRYGSRLGGLTAVDGVDLCVPEGGTLGLVGESGSGKSTLARAAVGLAPISSGRITLDGRPVPLRGRRRPVQLVFQDPYSSLDPRMTIGASIAESIPRDGVRRAAGRRAEVERLLDLVELDPEYARAYPGAMSGGQRQRVALARALAARPEVIIADEITSALDVSIQGTVLNLVRRLQRELGTSMLFISHNLAVVRYVATTVAVMYYGRIVETGPTAALLAEPEHPYTRDLLAALSEVGTGPGRDTGRDPQDVAVTDTEPPDPHHPPSGCRYHPRCPIGPLVHSGREICTTAQPTAGHRHRAACHFAAAAPAAATRVELTPTPTP